MKYTLLLFMCLEFRQIDEGFGGWLYINTKSKREAGLRRKVLHLRDAKKRDGLPSRFFKKVSLHCALGYLLIADASACTAAAENRPDSVRARRRQDAAAPVTLLKCEAPGSH